MKRLLLTSLFTVAASASFGQVNFIGTEYTQDFNSLSSTTVTGAFEGFSQVRAIPTLNGWYAYNQINYFGLTDLQATDGSTTVGGLKSMAVAGSSDRALGSLGNTDRSMAFGLALTNGVAPGQATIKDLEVSFDGVQYRTSTLSQNKLRFGYSIKTTAFAPNNLREGWVAFPTGDLMGSDPVTTNGAISPLVTPISFTIPDVNLLAGQTIILTWRDTNEAGQDAMLGIDNLKVKKIEAVPEPATMAALGLGVLGLARRRRNK
jgi:hypothetical protein